MKKSTKILTVILSALLLIASFGAAAVGALSYVNVNKLAASLEMISQTSETTKVSVKTVGEDLDELSAVVEDVKTKLSVGEDVAQENDVCIANDYWIRDTSAVSDAYKSGSSEGLDDRQKETLKMASDLLDKLIKKNMTSYDKEKAVYEWLTNNINSELGMLTVIPTSSESSDEPFGVLKYKSAVCVGYATTFRLLMQMLGMECMVVHDTSLTHSWDLVKLDDEWYHVDCYFDSECAYRHFNLDDAAFEQDHDWNKDFFPKAKGKKYSYALQNAVQLDDICSLPELVMDKVKANESVFACILKDIGKDDEALAVYMVNRIEEIINSGSGEMSFDHYWAEGEGQYTLCMFVTRISDTIEDVIDEETLETAEEALEKAFGDLYSPSDLYDDDHVLRVG